MLNADLLLYMTSSQIRQSFLDFFKSKQHTIVPSASLMPDSPNLLFTNAGMNQFVPIFLGQTKCPYNPGRAADTQKCIRAGGKHNDLDDVGLDTYHHTFFEMLGNWSFGDYFKQEAIAWAWELVVEIWKFPPPRLYATVYDPDKSQNDPSAFDQEAWNYWAEKFRSVGLDPAVHIVRGGKRDNFWMMGESGPCGPCSELHVDLTPQGETRGALVNQGDARCIEIWNLVFIQFNADADGAFSPLPARHVDTGLGFERVTGIMQGTKNFTDFEHAKISNYETDIFRPLFDKLAQLSGRNYRSTLPAAGTAHATEQEKIDIAFRVIADHIRTLSFAVADGIQPGNTGRNYVLRRILRRAVRYGRLLGFHEPFFYKLVEVLADTMGDLFPEIREKRRQVETVVQQEEEAFNKTLDRGIEMFNEEVARLSGGQREVLGGTGDSPVPLGDPPSGTTATSPLQSAPQAPGGAPSHSAGSVAQRHGQVARATQLSAQFAFKLYDTYGFPIDLTELIHAGDTRACPRSHQPEGQDRGHPRHEHLLRGAGRAGWRRRRIDRRWPTLAHRQHAEERPDLAAFPRHGSSRSTPRPAGRDGRRCPARRRHRPPLRGSSAPPGHPTPPYGHPFAALGSPRSRQPGGRAERFLRRPRQTHLRL